MSEFVSLTCTGYIFQGREKSLDAPSTVYINLDKITMMERSPTLMTTMLTEDRIPGRGIIHIVKEAPQEILDRRNR